MDINFGCPAKTVNKHKGGCVLMREPELMYEITAAVRKAVPADIPVTAKMRLGYDDRSMGVPVARLWKRPAPPRLLFTPAARWMVTSHPLTGKKSPKCVKR